MRKKVFGRQLARGANARKALFRSLIASLVEYEKISTTETKAKAIVPEVDGIVNMAKEGTTASLRRLYSTLGNNKSASKKLKEKIAPALSGRKSGYVRMIKLGKRRGDNAEMVRLEWSDQIETSKKKKDTSKKVVKAEAKVKTKAKTK